MLGNAVTGRTYPIHIFDYGCGFTHKYNWEPISRFCLLFLKLGSKLGFENQTHV